MLMNLEQSGADAPDRPGAECLLRAGAHLTVYHQRLTGLKRYEQDESQQGYRSTPITRQWADAMVHHRASRFR